VRVPVASRCVYLSPLSVVPEDWLDEASAFAPRRVEAGSVDLELRERDPLVENEVLAGDRDQLLRFYPGENQYVKPSGPVTGAYVSF